MGLGGAEKRCCFFVACEKFMSAISHRDLFQSGVENAVQSGVVSDAESE